MRILAGDIGGTNARLAVVELGENGACVLEARDYPSRSASGLAPLVLRFRETAEAGLDVDAASFALACPVVDGVCIAPNLPWTTERRALAEAIGVPRTTLINDFEAIGHALPFLRPSDVSVLQEGVPERHGPIAVIGAGTGLGVGFLVWNGGRYLIIPSEGGHAGFAPSNERERALHAYLEREYGGHVSSERVLSGPGLAQVYRFLAGESGMRESDEVRERMTREDPAAVIARNALDGTDPLCVAALDIFLAVFGAAAGNLALTVRATGGAYLAGGIAPRLLSRLRGDPFLAAFRRKGRLSAYAEQIPVRVITHPGVGLIGAAAVAAGATQ